MSKTRPISEFHMFVVKVPILQRAKSFDFDGMLGRGQLLPQCESRTSKERPLSMMTTKFHLNIRLFEALHPSSGPMTPRGHHESLSASAPLSPSPSLSSCVYAPTCAPNIRSTPPRLVHHLEASLYPRLRSTRTNASTNRHYQSGCSWPAGRSLEAHIRMSGWRGRCKACWLPTAVPTTVTRLSRQ